MIKQTLIKYKYTVAISIITILYAIVAFWGLGDTSSPQSFIYAEKGQEFIFDLGEEKMISQISLYAGIGHGEVVFSFSNDGENYSDEKTRELKNSAFTWQIENKAAIARYVKMSVLKSDNDRMMLGEIGFINGGKALNIFSGEEKLVDEQNVVQTDSNYYNSTYFDEVYHPRTAYEILFGLSPIYETTHPPLGKLFIALGIKIFGMTPFGWRFFGTLFGVLMLPAIYLLGTKLLKKKWAALLAAALFACDFMHFSLTRMATIDSYPVTFMLFAYYFLLVYIDKTRKGETKLSKNNFVPLIISGICWGLGCASKWISLYASFAILLIIVLAWLLIASKEKSYKFIIWHFFACVLSFIIIPCGIYIASYIPQAKIQMADDSYILWQKDGKGDYIQLEDGNFAKYDKTFLRIVIENQKSMYGYHSNLDATHPYASSALSWLYDGKPLWAYSHSTSKDTAAGISIFSNPVLCWLGVLAMLSLIVKFFYKPDFSSIVIILAFLAAYLPWLMVDRAIWKDSGRVLFAYHFFASIPFIILALCYWLQNLNIYVSIGVLIAVFAIFVWFYPAISGVEMNKKYMHTLVWGEFYNKETEKYESWGWKDKNGEFHELFDWVIYAK